MEPTTLTRLAGSIPWWLVLVSGGVAFEVSCGSSDSSSPTQAKDAGADADAGTGGSANDASSDGDAAVDQAAEADGVADAKPPPNLGTWKLDPLVGGDKFTAIWGSGPDDIYIVGGNFYDQNGYGGLTLHYGPTADGGLAWQPFGLNPGMETRYLDVAGAGPNQAFILGQWASPGPPPTGGMTLNQWDGSTWTAESPVFNGAMFGSAATGVWATGSVAGQLCEVLHFEGGQWVAKHTAPVLNESYGAPWAGGGHVLALSVSTADGQFVLDFDGANWNKIPLPAGSTPLTALWATGPSDVFVVGEYGTVLHYDGQSWATQPTNTNIYLSAIWGSSAYDVFAVGTGGIVHYDGDTWTEEPVPDLGLHNDIVDVWGSGPSDVYAIVGTGKQLLHRTP